MTKIKSTIFTSGAPLPELPVGYKRLLPTTIVRAEDKWYNYIKREFQPTMCSGGRLRQGFYIRKVATSD